MPKYVTVAAHLSLDELAHRYRKAADRGKARMTENIYHSALLFKNEMTHKSA